MLQIGNYELLGRLGRGGMAEVFRVRAVAGPMAGVEFALKRLLPELESDPEAVALFAGEADLARFLNHPNIVRVHEVGTFNDAYFMVMELVDGRDVGQIMKKCVEKRIDWPTDFAVFLVKTLLEALSYAHGAVGANGRPLNVVHCDISPSNFFVSRKGDLKLGDFGVARALIDQGLGEVMGKPFYLSPEALAGQLSQSIDLWACTVTLYELLTMQRPFQGKDHERVYDAIRSRKYVSPRSIRPDISKGLEDVIAKGFSKKPEARFQSAAEFAEALTPHFDELVGTSLAISSMVRGLFGATG